MKEFVWSWFFWLSFVFCSLLAVSLVIAYWLYSTAPQNQHTPIFATGFGFVLGFFGLGVLTASAFEHFSKKNLIFKEFENEFFNRVIREVPFLFFALFYFFSLSLYIGIFMLVLGYIEKCF